MSWRLALIEITVTSKVPGAETGGYEALFLVDTEASDSMAPVFSRPPAYLKRPTTKTPTQAITSPDPITASA